MTATSVTEIELTTNPGLEVLAFDELAEACAAAGLPAPERRDSGMKGRLLAACAAPWGVLDGVARGLRCVHHVLRPLDHFTLPDDEPLEAVRSRLRNVPIPDLADGTRTFRVTATRVGAQGFTSDDVARMAGAGIIDRSGNPVNLTAPEVTVRVDVVDAACSVGIQVTDKALSLRHGLAYRQRVSLRATVAYAMLRMSGLSRRPRLIADPFMGSGTLLLEAGVLFPEAALFGGDKFDRPAEGARRNLEEAGLIDRTRIVQGDARDIDQVLAPGSVDLMVSNPPFGVQLGRRMNFFEFYRRWLRASRPVLGPDGRIVALVARRDAFQAACKRAGYRVLATRVVEASNLFVTIFVIAPYRDVPSADGP